MEKRMPTGEQLEALKAYAAEHGRTWKHQLWQEWQDGTDIGLLRQIRNEFGPRWLHTQGGKAVR